MTAMTMTAGETRTARRRRIRRARADRRLLALFLLLTLAGSLLWAAPTIGQAWADRHQAIQARQATSRTITDAQAAVARAQDYNARLAADQTVIGEESDPFSGKAGGDFGFEDDTDYQRTLDMGGGIMGELRIPRISLDLPIRHGSDEPALRTGIGHLHGTSLPVGGASTHAVLTGHRGSQDATLFTRLDELSVGDPIYIDTMGRLIAYQVDKVYPSLTPAQALDHLRITKGEDRLTLVTCTPILVNTHRLLVTAHRATMPGMVAWPDQAEGDPHPWPVRHWKALAAGIPLTGLAITILAPAPGQTGRTRRPHGLTARHATT